MSYFGHIGVAPRPFGGPSPGNGPTPLRCDAALAALFAPPRPAWGHYEACTAEETVDGQPSDGFTYTAVERLEALDAFGAAGAYDRPRLAQLYGGRRVLVVRGWRTSAGRFESVTRISPYPDASLARLHEGTMIVRWIAER